MPLCFIGVGSNVGPRFAQVCRAWQLVQAEVGAVVATSHLYDTAPAGLVVDQPRFLNGVICASTALGPEACLRALQGIERAMGRVFRGRHGPREIDLDLLFHGENVVDSEDLVVPHPRVEDRAFVLRPLADARRALEDGGDDAVPKKDVGLVDAALARGAAADATLRRVWASLDPAALVVRGDRTRVMGVLNATPDSFSDGGLNLAVDAALARAEEMVARGVDVIDVGGESTRPGATQPPLAVELDRVLPVLEGLRRNFPGLPLSVDTRRRDVALAATAAGATLTNDVSGGAFDAAMLPELAKDGDARGVCLMHARGTPLTMTRPEHATYDGGVVPVVARELAGRVRAATDAGVPPWRLLIDPGIGFAKDTKANVALLRGLGAFAATLGDLPVLLGPSRKRFLGDLADEPVAAERDFATAGACAATVPHADVVRVHDVRAAKHALAVADALRR